MRRIKQEVHNMLYEVAVQYEDLLSRAKEAEPEEAQALMQEAEDLMWRYTDQVWYVIRRERRKYKR